MSDKIISYVMQEACDAIIIKVQLLRKMYLQHVQ